MPYTVREGQAGSGRVLDRGVEGSDEALKRTARSTGIWYLALAIAGLVGYLIIRPRIYAPMDPAETLANLTDQEGLARLGLAFELALVVTQSVAAVWFYKLFRGFNAVAAWAIAAFGVANAIAIMASAGFLGTALVVAGDAGLAPAGDAAATVQLLYEMSSQAWGVGALFFGLWLIPMGYVAYGSGRMPKWLGRILVIGGVGYVLSAFLAYGLSGAPEWLVEGLTYPASLGEFWMIGYLLIVGIRLVGADRSQVSLVSA